MSMATKKKQTKKKKGSSRKKKGPDSDLVFIGIVALLAALAALYWKGPAEIFWYGLPAAVGIALLYEAYT